MANRYTVHHTENDDSRMQEQDRLLSIAWEQFRPDTSGLADDPAPTSGSRLSHSSIAMVAGLLAGCGICLRVRPLAKVKVQDIQNALATRGMTVHAYESSTSTTLWLDFGCVFAQVADMPDGFLAALNKETCMLK